MISYWVLSLNRRMVSWKFSATTTVVEDVYIQKSDLPPDCCLANNRNSMNVLGGNKVTTFRGPEQSGDGRGREFICRDAGSTGYTFGTWDFNDETTRGGPGGPYTSQLACTAVNPLRYNDHIYESPTSVRRDATGRVEESLGISAGGCTDSLLFEPPSEGGGHGDITKYYDIEPQHRPREFHQRPY